MKLPVTEHQIQNTLINYLKYKGYFVMRMNSGAIRSLNEHGRLRMIRMHDAGTPDIMAFKAIGVNKQTYGIPEVIDLLFIEVKTPKNKPTPLQAAKMAELASFGARCLVIHSLEELQKML